MKKYIAGHIAVLVLVTAPLFAQPPYQEETVPYDGAVQEFLQEREALTIDQVTIGELRELGMTLSVIAQEEDYVQRAQQSSYLMPGSGHFVIGEYGRGSVFAASSIVVAIGTLIGAYLVLPADVQFSRVNYIDDSFKEIGNAWRGESIASMLPAIAVLTGGGLVNSILAEFASENAVKLAREQLESGTKTFEPKPFIYPDAQGRLILGARIGL